MKGQWLKWKMVSQLLTHRRYYHFTFGHGSIGDIQHNNKERTRFNYHKITYCLLTELLTHWGRVTHICVSKITIIGSDNGLSPGRSQAIIWTSVGTLLIWPLGTNFSEILIEIYTFSFKKMHLKMSSAKWRPFCLGLNALNILHDNVVTSQIVFESTIFICN